MFGVDFICSLLPSLLFRRLVRSGIDLKKSLSPFTNKPCHIRKVGARLRIACLRNIAETRDRELFSHKRDYHTGLRTSRSLFEIHGSWRLIFVSLIQSLCLLSHILRLVSRWLLVYFSSATFQMSTFWRLGVASSTYPPLIKMAMMISWE